MTSKIFKSTATNRTLTVEGHFNGAFAVVFSDDSSLDLMLQGGDAPALALAILKAAGVPESSDAGVAVSYLRSHIAEQERTTAEALERAELEAEALDYWKAFHKAMDSASFDDIQWSDLMPETQSKWLAVARRARELAKEATK